MVRGTRIQQITADHTLAAELENAGRGTAVPPEARNILTRSLGVEATVRVDVSADPLPVDDGNVLILCSDGLTGMIEDQELAQGAQQSPAAACTFLIDRAKEEGGLDNVTVVVMRFQIAR
jgi:protein phosphatase